MASRIFLSAGLIRLSVRAMREEGWGGGSGDGGDGSACARSRNIISLSPHPSLVGTRGHGRHATASPTPGASVCHAPSCIVRG